MTEHMGSIGDAVGRALAERLERDGFARELTTVRTAPGPLGTLVVTAAATGAYPSAGVRAALVDDDRAYGTSFDGGMAELTRARGWHAEPPEAEVLAEIASYVMFEGMLQLDERSAPVVMKKGESLRLTLVRRLFPSGARQRVTVMMPPSGREQVEMTDLDVPLPAPIPIDRATGLVRALDAGDVAETLSAIRALQAPSQPREYAALARAATHADKMVAADALLAIGAGDEAAAALRAALAAASAARRDIVLALAAEAWGADFAARLV